VRQEPTSEQVAMAAAINVRSSDDADYSEAAVPWTVLNRLAQQVGAEGAELHLVVDHETRLKMLRRTRSLRNAGVLAVIGSKPGDELAAGAALSAVLLMGTVWGLHGGQLPVRPLLARRVLGPDLVAQVVLRLGYPRT
jgi:NADPH:quinone reductase-like Zn-dependent oxidoreductase